MSVRITQSSFTRGELTPRLDARTNLEQYAIGLKTAKNAIIHQEGGISNRMGLEYVGTVKYSDKESRLMKFVFNQEQTYMLEFGHHYIRFIQDGGYITYPADYKYTYEGTFTECVYEDEETSELFCKYILDNGDIIYINEDSEAQTSDKRRCLSNDSTGVVCYSDSDCTEIYTNNVSDAKGIITSINFTSENSGVISIDSEQLGPVGEIVEIESPYNDIDLKNIKRSQAGDILTLTHQNYPPANLVRYSHYDWRLEPCTFQSKVTAPINVTAVWTGSVSSNTRTYSYVVTAVDSNNEESERSEIVEVLGHREANWTTTEYMTISWDEVSNATEYNVYRSVNGIFGYCGTAQGTSFVDDCIEPDLKSSAPISKNPFENANNPSCSCYYQQRKIYANSLNNPQTLWASQTAAPDNFNVSRPLIATDSITITMDDREVNEIRHLIPLKDLVVLTTNSEWRVNGTDGIFQANPTPAAVVQSCYGSSHVEPVISGSMVIFVQAGGGIIRDLGYDYLSDAYDGEELSIFSSHLFEGKQIKYMSYAKEPYRLLWVVFDDGSAVSMTYNKKQKLCGWTRVETKGAFESVESVREGNEDVTYFIISRKINNQVVKYVERTRTRIINDATKAFLVDSGLSATFDNPVSIIHGLEHLEGEKVVVNADGGIILNLTVQNGTINLPSPAKNVVVGLPYEFEFATLNIEDDNSHGLKKVVNHISAKIYKSREDFAFVGDDGVEYFNPRSYESINDSSKLFSKDISATVFATPKTDANIKIKQSLPLPLTILSVSATVDVQDNENL